MATTKATGRLNEVGQAGQHMIDRIVEVEQILDGFALPPKAGAAVVEALQLAGRLAGLVNQAVMIGHEVELERATIADVVSVDNDDPEVEQ